MIASPDIPDMTATGQQVLVEGPVPRPDDRKDWKMPASAVAAALAQRETTPLQPVVFVATSERRADEIAAALAVMVGDAEVLVLPPWDCLPYDRAAPSRESMGRRMAVLAALAGGMMAADMTMGISAAFFMQSLPDAVEVGNLWLAMGKSVVFGVFIALIGCHWGLRVKPNTQSLGEGTTASVVTSITMVIIVDAIFAVAFRNVGI